MLTVVVNCRRDTYDIYIGRGSPYGNPFKIGVHGSREEVITKYRKWALTQPALLGTIEALRGKRLGCWCKPQACHGDVLVEILELTSSEASAIIERNEGKAKGGVVAAVC